MIAEVENPRRRALVALGATFAVYVGTVATHQGEFWPFSIFPMFSRAGKPWTRAMVLDISPDVLSAELRDQGALGWGPWSLNELPGKRFPTRPAGVSTNDLSAVIQRTKAWTEERQRALQTLFATSLNEGRTLLLLRVVGTPQSDGGIDINFTGVVKINSQRLVINPDLA